ncbi:hypothetical protein [Olleya marilimosa]|uniref:Uncharacterized protein n=1 Tax=Olleya marilimosa TaxID=272164 RepID=A0ABR8LQ25_9FLAO|nr:hypothetical protein [Olleya marilimosa]MBD3862325.1 hypothetical protein [Olleya marilimosa]
MNLLNFITLADSDYRLIFSIVTALFGAIIGGGITIWYKKKEIKHLSENLSLQFDNLDLQKRVFEEASKNNELKMKAELVRLEDLNRQYQLNLQKHDFEHLSKVLDFAGDSNEKVKMLKDFAKIIENYRPTDMYYSDESEYEEFTVNHVYFKLSFIESSISKLLQDHPNVFNTLHSDFNGVSRDAKYLIGYSGEISSYHDEIDIDQIIDQLRPSLLKLNKNFYSLLDKMKQQFLELDTLKSNYIKSQFENRTIENK